MLKQNYILTLLSKSIVKSAMLAVLMLCSFSATALEMKHPELVVKETVNAVVGNIQENRAEYRADNQKLFAMVDDILVPTLHIERMANLILGKENATRATAEQKAAFANEFKTFLMRSYATALLEYTGNEKVIYEPVNLPEGADKITVRATLVAADGQAYPIVLYMSNRRDTSWRAYNLDVAGINFVGTYRTTFGDIISRKGVDGLIAELRDKNNRSVKQS